MRVHRDDAPVGIRQLALIGERIVDAGRRVERQVDVVDDILLVAPLAVDVVGFDRHRAAELTLEADRASARCAAGARTRAARRIPGRRAAGRRSAGEFPRASVEGAVLREQNCVQRLRVGRQRLPLVGFAAKSGRPSLVYWMTAIWALPVAND